MAFANNAPQGNSNIDWDAMNNEIVNIVGTQNKKEICCWYYFRRN